MHKLFMIGFACLGFSSVAMAQDAGKTVDLELFRPYSDAFGYMAAPSAPGS